MQQHVIWLCDGCRQIFDDLQPEGGEAHWVPAHAFLLTYRFQWDELDIIHDTCPSCARHGQNRTQTDEG